MPSSGTSLVAQMVKNLPAIQESRFQSLGQEDPLEKKMATHSNILAWKIPWTKEPGYSPWNCKELDMIEQLRVPGQEMHGMMVLRHLLNQKIRSLLKINSSVKRTQDSK